MEPGVFQTPDNLFSPETLLCLHHLRQRSAARGVSDLSLSSLELEVAPQKVALAALEERWQGDQSLCS